MADRETRSTGEEGLPPWEAIRLPDRKHSGLGIASFVVWFFAAVGFLTAFVILVAEEEFADGQPLDSTPIEVLAASIGAASAFVAICGLGLGLLGMLQRDRQKVFAFIGAGFNAMTLLGAGLMVAAKVLGD